MEQMEDKDKHMVTESRNRKKLLEEVELVVVSFRSIIPFTTLSEQDRISPYNIKTISSRQMMRI